jgi:hypothetical protein
LGLQVTSAAPFYYPVGDARKALLTFAALLEGKPAPHAEKWEPDLVP